MQSAVWMVTRRSQGTNLGPGSGRRPLVGAGQRPLAPDNGPALGLRGRLALGRRVVIEASAAPAAVGVKAADLSAAAAAARLGRGRDNRDCFESSGCLSGRRRPRDAHPRQRDVVLIVRMFMKWRR